MVQTTFPPGQPPQIPVIDASVQLLVSRMGLADLLSASLVNSLFANHLILFRTAPY